MKSVIQATILTGACVVLVLFVALAVVAVSIVGAVL